MVLFLPLCTLRGMKRKSRIIALGSLLAAASAAHAQVPVVLNGGFEAYSTAPLAPGQWYHAVQWGNAGSTEASPDFFHQDGTGGGDLPETPLALVDAHSGKGIMGFSAATADGSSRREYLVGRFAEPLEVGQRYRLRFAFTNGEVTAFSPAGGAVSGFAVALAASDPVQAGLAPLDLPAVFQFNAPVYNRDWQDVAFEFTATEPWSNVVFGVFAPDASVVFEAVEGGAPQLAYYFLDSVQLELAPEGAEAVDAVKGPSAEPPAVGEEEGSAPWFVPNAFSPNADGENDVFKPVLNAGKLLSFEVYSRWGEVLFAAHDESEAEWDGTDDAGAPVPLGTYVWKLRLRDESGRRQESSGTVVLLR